MTRRTLMAALGYSALTFGAGFVLGPLRIYLLVPRLGARDAELLELPVMLAVCWLAARWLTRRLAVPAIPAQRLGMGLLAVALLLLCEFTLVLQLRGLTLQDYLTTRDPVSGTAYYCALIAMALLPLFVNRQALHGERRGPD